MRTILIALGCFFTVFAAFPYTWETLRGRAKPKIASWLIWTALQSIGATASFSQHQIPAGLYTLCCAIECGCIVLLGFSRGDRHFELMDIVCLTGASIGLITLLFLHVPTIAVLVSIVTDCVGGLPTLKHCWKSPKEETWITYTLFGIGSALTLCVANFRSMTAVTYPAYLLLFDTTATLLIIMRRKRLSTAETSGTI